MRTEGLKLIYGGAGLLALALISVGNLSRQSTQPKFLELDYEVPRLYQLIATMGDRFLASNVATWRAVVVRTERMSPAMIASLAKLQVDSSWFNPGHEDNYYTANAILPPAGYLTETQYILQRASDARFDDVWPPFFLGFNRMYFQGDYRGAAEAVIQGSKKTNDVGTQNALSLMAAKWLERQGDIEVAVSVMKGMASATKDPALRSHLETRVVRLIELGYLRELAAKFRSEHGYPAESVMQLQGWHGNDRQKSITNTNAYAIIDGEVVLQGQHSSVNK